ncbi:hypothetical protein COCCADRAFT_41954 [Bipolaris zeicola 26-R-13]|uniref:Cupin 2 conserved barrel domain-containing protein n=1 Tax=Cochliobolus carbonum (strain 26-R-13) TaxID=930089 RepID=W6XJE6_COCC2|nr:uncharacterized protein COCCADRAFT_41954 [Bipolaris zeicola 26-R-13]EUC27262.1 hypothetical protein COCCADRAFT_41954 [Bipolaris zeicola 26-R-13]
MQLIRSSHLPESPSKQLSGPFTGSVHFDPIFFSEDGTACGNVSFAPGARSYWHIHEKGQILTEPRRLQVGDVVHIPGGEKHWHGATGNTLMVHTAISLGDCKWHEEVSEPDYEKANKSAI